MIFIPEYAFIRDRQGSMGEGSDTVLAVMGLVRLLFFQIAIEHPSTYISLWASVGRISTIMVLCHNIELFSRFTIQDLLTWWRICMYMGE